MQSDTLPTCHTPLGYISCWRRCLTRLPCVYICQFSSYGKSVYFFSFISQSVYIILSVGASIILAFAFVMCRISSLRFSAAPYYLCLRDTLSPSDAIKKSILFTDGYLSEGVVLEYSLIGWILSCLLVVPIFYVLPYVKLSRCVFVSEMLLKKPRTKSDSFPISYLSQHIN
jgi:uncharacterized membrane protein